MNNSRTVAVLGAYGHTGRFVVAELQRRSWTPILCGRDPARLDALGEAWPSLPRRRVSIDNPASLDRALEGASAAINCAGPFLDTANAVIEAALRARIHSLDIAAEQAPVQAAFERYDDAAHTAGVAILPAMAFYGGLADLLATAAMSDWTTADSIEIAVALDSWHPTAGTRLTGQRNTAPRVTVSDGRLATLADPPPKRIWTFPPPFGTVETVGLPLSEIVLIHRHLRATKVDSYMSLAPLADLRDPTTPPPVAADASGRSAQRFAIDIVATRNGETRRAGAQGRDIYAVTAPLIVEALQRLADGRCRATGVVAAGQAFDARDFLSALSPESLSLTPLPRAASTISTAEC